MRNLVDIAVDHMLLWLFVKRMDFEIPQPLATLCPALTFLTAAANVSLGQKRRPAFAYALSTAFSVATMLWIDARSVHRFLVLWASTLGLSMVSERWGLVDVRGLLCERRHPIDLAMARIVISALLVITCSSKESTDAMMLHNGADLYIPRDVARCDPSEQTDLPTGLPIPGLAFWPKFQFKTIHMEEKLLVLVAICAMLGFCSRASLIGMSILELRVFGQQFFFSRQLVDFEKGGGVEVMASGLHHHHRETLLVWSSLMLALSPCSDVLSIDSLFSGLFSRRKLNSVRPIKPTVAHGLSINFTLLLLGIGYMCSGLAKAGAGPVFGLSWPKSYVFDAVIDRHFRGYSELVARGVINRNWLYAYGESRALREKIVAWPVINGLGSLLAMVWEISYLALVSHRGIPRTIGMILGLGFHAMVYMLTKISFGMVAINYLVFVPWSRVFRILINKHKLAIGFNEGSRAHQKMIRVLQSLDVGASLTFVGDRSDQKYDLVSDGNWLRQVHLPEAPISASEGRILRLMIHWVKSDRIVRKHSPHLYPILRVAGVGANFLSRVQKCSKETLHVNVLGACRSCRGPMGCLESVRMRSFVGVVCSVGLLWTGLTGRTKCWPFPALPRFVPPSLPSQQVSTAEHSFIAYSIIQAWAVGAHGNSSMVDLRPLLISELGRASGEEFQHLMEHGLDDADQDELRKPLRCGGVYLVELPLWYRWLTSWAIPNTDVTIGVSEEVDRSWSQVLRKSCWDVNGPEGVGFRGLGKGGRNGKLAFVCDRLRDSVRIDFLRKGMNVQSGPPWGPQPWDASVKVHQIKLPPTPHRPGIDVQ